MINTLHVPTQNINVIFDIHRCINDIQHARLPMHPQTRAADMFKEIHCDFLRAKINEDDWKHSVFLKENRFEKKQQIGQVLQTFVTAGTEVFRSLYTDMLNMGTVLDVKKIKDRLDEFYALRAYINITLENLGLQMLCAVPQIGNTWEYIQPKNPAKLRTDTEKKETAEMEKAAPVKDNSS
jgi:hypothetical protein